jgi:outer membrane protein OmpA-like peptidoglycan-associated protein
VAEPEPPKKPAVISVTSTGLFEFNRSALTPDARAKLDKEIVARGQEFASIALVHVDGHADRLGSAQHNQRHAALGAASGVRLRGPDTGPFCS